MADDIDFTRTVTIDCGLARHLMFVDYRPLGAFIAESAIPDIADYMRYWRGVWHRERTEDHQQPQPLPPRVLTGGGEDG